MPIALAGLLALSLFALFSAASLMGMQNTRPAWLQALLDGMRGSGGGILGTIRRAVTWPFRLTIEQIYNYVSHMISKAASHLTHPLANWLQGAEYAITAANNATAAFAESVAHAFDRLVTHTLPREIGRATRPINQRAKRATKIAIGAGLSAAAAWKAIQQLRRHGIPNAVNRAVHRATAVAERGWARERARAKNAERALSKQITRLLRGFAGGAAALLGLGLFVRWLARKLPWLFCHKVNKLGRRVCSLPTDLFDVLFASAVLVGTLNVRQFAKETADIAEDVMLTWREFSEDWD